MNGLLKLRCLAYERKLQGKGVAFIGRGMNINDYHEWLHKEGNEEMTAFGFELFLDVRSLKYIIN